MNKTITKNLRKLRQGKRLTQEYVAERLGVSAKAVSRWEKGDSTPDIEKLIAISDMFEISLVNIPLLPTFLPKLPVKARRNEKIGEDTKTAPNI